MRCEPQPMANSPGSSGSRSDLLSADFVNDTRSGVVDGPSTMVIDDRMVKILTWYDNEYGYAFRMADLAARVAAEL